MATLTRGKTFTSTEQVTNSKLHQLVDSASISSITNADIDSSAGIAASKLNLAAIAQAMTISQLMTMSGAAIDHAKGSDIASATTTDIGAATGNYVDVTGTTTITGLGTIQAGVIRIVRFTGALTLTHNATSLILPGGANITTVAGDVAVFVSLGSGNWRCVSYTKIDGSPLSVPAGGVVQVVNSLLTTPVNVTSVYTADDTPPLYSEGQALASVSITPQNASNKLLIRGTIWGSPSGSNDFALWVNDDTGSDEALAVVKGQAGGGGGLNFHVEFYVTAGSTSARTYYLVGATSSGTFYVGRSNAGADLFGAAAFGSLTVEEIKA